MNEKSALARFTISILRARPENQHKRNEMQHKTQRSEFSVVYRSWAPRFSRGGGIEVLPGLLPSNCCFFRVKDIGKTRMYQLGDDELLRTKGMPFPKVSARVKLSVCEILRNTQNAKLVTCQPTAE